MSAETEDMSENSSDSAAQVQFRREVRAWCDEHVPRDWRSSQTGVGDEEFVRFQKSWFAELRSAGFAVPHWPVHWGGGMPVAVNGIVVGAVAVSGLSEEEDARLAQLGVEAILKGR